MISGILLFVGAKRAHVSESLKNVDQFAFVPRAPRKLLLSLGTNSHPFMRG
jgi:hypothetical protein